MEDQPPREIPQLDLESLLPVRSLIVVLEALESSRPGFFHQPALAAFLRHLTNSPDNFDRHIRLDSPESGRIHYQAGQYYRFQVFILGEAPGLAQTLIQSLKKLPHSAPRNDQPLPFRGNWRLHSLQDGFSTLPIRHAEELSAFGPEELEQESRLWQGHEQLHWLWLSPARLLKDKTHRKDLKGEARYCHDSRDLNGALLLERLHDAFADLLRRGGQSPSPRPASPPCELQQAHLFWMDATYRDMKGKTSAMGGLSGIAQLKLPPDLPLAWWKLLVLGQYSGMGQRTAFGWGRYQLQTMDKLLSYRRCLPAASLLQWCRDPDNLSGAWRHVMSNTDIILDPAETWREDDELDSQPPEAPIQRLQADLDNIAQGSYVPPPLRGYLIPKKNGGVRPLAVPPIYDRVLQRGVAQILTPALEKLMSQGSHGFRPGRSRITARYAIQAAWREGYRWVYESDIRDFFDSVRLDLLEDRLRAIYGEDPLVAAILKWMRADVIFQGERIERHHGLPQGSPLSPLMANLMLDDFDSDMEALGFRLIRFADDFIILCKTPEEAEAAGQAARASLEEHGLKLHPDKTRITPMEDGFKYLGYLFVNDMALDVSGSRPGAEKPALQPPPHSWLALLGEREPLQLKRKQALEELAARILKGRPFPIGEREDNKTLLVISGEPSTISTLNRHVRVYRKDKRIADMPWRNLQALLLLGNHQITTQAMHAALQNQVNIHLANGYGRYQGCLTQSRGSQGHKLWLRQLVSFEDADKALFCAREIVGARLRHMKETLRQRKAAADLPQLDHGIRNIHKAPDLDALRGLEGRATREYYARIATLLPAELKFSGRNRRPPRDPFNVLLSLGHTVIYGYSQSILHTVGLLPWQGFYHQGKGRHAALASDLMEPFRHLVERAALTLVLRQEITHRDFSWPESGGCRIHDDARRKFLARLLLRWEVKVRARGQEQPQSYFTHMHQQALSLKNFIAHGEVFQPFRLR